MKYKERNNHHEVDKAVLKQINQVIVEALGEDRANEVWFNGTRAEGCSIIVEGSVWSYQIEALMAAFNRVSGLFEKELGEWRVRKAAPNFIANQEVPEHVRNDCYEVRMIFKNYYTRV